MSMVFIYNTKCEFDPVSKQIKYGSTSWMLPIEAIKSVKITEKKDKLDFDITVDGTTQA